MESSQEWPSLGHLAPNLNQASKKISLQQPHPARQALANELLLKTVLGNLSTKKLLRFRKVNQVWNAEACKILSKRNALMIDISFPYHSENDAAAFSSNQRAETRLKFLMEAIVKSSEIDSIFPLCEYRIHNPQLCNPIVDKFFITCGYIIQNFWLMFPYVLANEDSEFWHRLIDMLFSKLPNLRQLYIDINNWFLKGNEAKYFKQFFLPVGTDQGARILKKLKVIKFGCAKRSSILNCILQAAINLEEIHMRSLCNDIFESMAMIKAMVAHGKNHLLSSLHIHFHRIILGLTESLVEKGFAWIKTLHIHFCEGHFGKDEIIRARNVLNKIITLNSHILERLYLFPFYLYESFRFPAMPKLHTLTFDYYYFRCQPFTLSDFKLSLLFPRLKALKIDTYACEGMRMGMLGESLLGASYTDQVSSLKSIEFLNQPLEVCTMSLPQMFPNLVCVNMGELWNVPQAFSALWSLPHLKILAFEVVRQDGNDVGISENLAYQLESALTGFSTETCFKLASDRSVLEMQTVEALRVNRSMLDAKCLRELNITVHYCYGEETTTGHTPVFSRVAGLFAFRMCPQVEVFIKLHALSQNNAAALEADIHSVLDYVTSVDETRHFISRDGSTFFRCETCEH